MKERIKELAEQAGLRYYNCNTNESNVVDGEFKYPRLEDYEKFAELIVDELDKVLMDNHYGDPHEIPYFIDDVKKHFGVEQ